MPERKAAPGEVEQSIARLRELRYMTRGAGAKPRREPKMPTVAQLRTEVAKIAVKRTKKKARKGKQR